jgi:hypothetical protein
MTSQTGKNRHDWRRAARGAVAGSVLAVGFMAGAGAPTAFAEPEPADPTTEAAAPAMTADQALAIIAQDYDTGAGGGQLSNLIHEVLLLRNQGFKPSNANKQAITAALDKRPNQAPLVEALKETIVYQRKLQAQMANQGAGGQQPGFNYGVGQPPPGMGPTLPPGVPPDPGDANGGAFIGVPGAAVTQPVG